MGLLGLFRTRSIIHSVCNALLVRFSFGFSLACTCLGLLTPLPNGPPIVDHVNAGLALFFQHLMDAQHRGRVQWRAHRPSDLRFCKLIAWCGDIVVVDKMSIVAHCEHMKNFSAKDAKNHFGQMMDAARLEPVVIEKHGRPMVVVCSVEEFERLSQAAARASGSGRNRDR